MKSTFIKALMCCLAALLGYWFCEYLKTGYIGDVFANWLTFYISPYYTVALGKHFCDFWSFILLPLARKLVTFEECFEELPEKSVKIIIATPKSGTAFAGKLLSLLSVNCGIASGISNGIESDWPNIKSFPSEYEYDLQFMLAYASQWDTYLDLPFNKEKDVQCLVFTRNPFNRLLSLYSYTRDGTEFGLRGYSLEMSKLRTFKERLRYLWETLGKPVFRESQIATLKALERNCTQIFSDMLFSSPQEFQKEVEKIFNTFKVRQEARQDLLRLISLHDLSQSQKVNFHFSGRSLEDGEKDAVRLLIKNDVEISSFLKEQCIELNYMC